MQGNVRVPSVIPTTFHTSYEHSIAKYRNKKSMFLTHHFTQDDGTKA